MHVKHGAFGTDGDRRWWLHRLYFSDEKSGCEPCALSTRGVESACSILWEEEGMSLEADCGKTETNTIVFLYKGGKTDDDLRPGGQKWCVNEDGTVSPENAKHMVLGHGTREHKARQCGGKRLMSEEVSDGVLILVPRNDARQLMFDNGEAQVRDEADGLLQPRPAAQHEPLFNDQMQREEPDPEVDARDLEGWWFFSCCLIFNACYYINPTSKDEYTECPVFVGMGVPWFPTPCFNVRRRTKPGSNAFHLVCGPPGVLAFIDKDTFNPEETTCGGCVYIGRI